VQAGGVGGVGGLGNPGAGLAEELSKCCGTKWLPLSAFVLMAAMQGCRFQAKDPASRGRYSQRCRYLTAFGSFKCTGMCA